MPVKVRCPGCDKVLNAPDAARGKAIKCPGCETKIRVPVGDGEEAGGRTAVKTATKKKAGQDSMEFLANVDLSKAADTSVNMCPKCGADIPDDASECPKCGVDPTTGQLSANAKKRVGRKGPDPAEFYRVVWKNSWAFTMANKKGAIRLMMYAVWFSLIAGGCNFMANWCTRGKPPQLFWAGMTFVSNLLVPGLLWALTMDVVRATVTRKSDISSFNSDNFQNIALGIKTLLWSFVISFPFGLTIFLYPLCMIHMAMPVTKRAWFWPSMLSTFFKNAGPTIYYWIIAFVVNLPIALAWGVLIGFFWSDILEALQKIQSGGQPTIRIPLAVTASVIGLFVIIYGSFSSLFLMRVIGLIASYRRDTLDLVTLITEKEYIRKEVKLDAFGNPIRSSGQKVAAILVPLMALAVAGATGYFIYYSLFLKKG